MALPYEPDDLPPDTIWSIHGVCVPLFDAAKPSNRGPLLVGAAAVWTILGSLYLPGMSLFGQCLTGMAMGLHLWCLAQRRCRPHLQIDRDRVRVTRGMAIELDLPRDEVAIQRAGRQLVLVAGPQRLALWVRPETSLRSVAWLVAQLRASSTEPIHHGSVPTTIRELVRRTRAPQDARSPGRGERPRRRRCPRHPQLEPCGHPSLGTRHADWPRN